MLYGQKMKLEQSEPMAPKSIETLSESEKRRLTKELYSGDHPYEVQKRFALDSGSMLHPDEVKRFHDEVFVVLEEKKEVPKPVADEIADWEAEEYIRLNPPKPVEPVVPKEEPIMEEEIGGK